MHAILRRDESEDIYRELVEGLADNVVPVMILCGVMVSTGIYVLSIASSLLVLAATVVCAVTSIGKIALILHHQRHRTAYQRASLDRVRRTETLHAATTIAVCLSVGFLSVSIFCLPQPVLHLIPLCIVFGYGAGLIARVSIRPHIAAGALLSILLPGAITMAWLGGQHLFVAGVITIFIGAALQSVAFVYETSKRAVALRLQMEALARRDPLSGLLNRFGLREAFEVLSRGLDQTVAVHAFDLDRFKAVNDAFGHAAGDRLIRILAARIRSTAPDGSIVARIGGDEFVLVQLGDEADAQRLAELIHRELTNPCDIAGLQPVRVGLSLGFAVSQLSQASLDDLIQQADSQSYAVKRDGGGVRGGALTSRASSIAVVTSPMTAAA